MKSNSKFYSDWITGQYHFQNGGKKEDLSHPNARAGYESAENFRRNIQEKILNKN